MPMTPLRHSLKWWCITAVIIVNMLIIGNILLRSLHNTFMDLLQHQPEIHGFEKQARSAFFRLPPLFSAFLFAAHNTAQCTLV